MHSVTRRGVYVLACISEFVLWNFCLKCNYSFHSPITKAVIKIVLLCIIKCPEVKLEISVALALCDV